MSADNYILVKKEDTHWVGYMQCASRRTYCYHDKLFCADEIEDAIILAQDIDTEYGYKFEVGDFYGETYFPKLCKCCGHVELKQSRITNDIIA